MVKDPERIFEFEPPFDDRFSIDVLPNCVNCYFYLLDFKSYLPIRDHLTSAFSMLLFLVPLRRGRRILLMIRYSSVDRSRQLRYCVQRPYWLYVIDIETLLIHSFISIDLLTVFCCRVNYRISVLVF